MASVETKKKSIVPVKDLRSFGLLVGGIFLLIGLFPLLRKLPVRPWVLWPGGALTVTGLLWPAILYWPYRFWMMIGHVLGWINSRIILGLVFTLVFTPTGLFQKLRGKDPLRRKRHPEKPSYKVPVPPKDPKSMERQF